METIIMVVCKNKMYCYHCGKEISEGTKFCPYCGASMLPKTEVIYKPEPVYHDDGALWKGLLFTLFLGFLGLLFVYLIYPDEGETKKGAWIIITIRLSLYLLTLILCAIFVLPRL